jgi:hypothetical protein
VIERILRLLFPKSWAEHDAFIRENAGRQLQFEVDTIIWNELQKIRQESA